jgi:hypothetical protein
MEADLPAASDSTSGVPPDAITTVSGSLNLQETPQGNNRPPDLLEPVFYISSSLDTQLRQAEILSNVFQYKIAVESLGDPDGVEIEPVIHEFAIILSQDCDLEQDFKSREAIRASGASLDRLDDKLLPSVLMCEVATERAIDDAIRSQGNTIRQRFRKNQEERYQFLHAVAKSDDAAGDGLEAMGIDFKRYFSVPTAELYAQLKSGCNRRCRLAPQYLEHLSKRFTNHLSRVGLPKNHHEP